MLKDASGKSKKCAYIKLADESVVESIMATDDHFIAPGSALKQTTYLSIYLSLSLSIYIYIYIYLSLYISISLSLYIYIDNASTYVYIYIYIYIYTHTYI